MLPLSYTWIRGGFHERFSVLPWPRERSLFAQPGPPIHYFQFYAWVSFYALLYLFFTGAYHFCYPCFRLKNEAQVSGGGSRGSRSSLWEAFSTLENDILIGKSHSGTRTRMIQFWGARAFIWSRSEHWHSARIETSFRNHYDLQTVNGSITINFSQFESIEAKRNHSVCEFMLWIGWKTIGLLSGVACDSTEFTYSEVAAADCHSQPDASK
jgi:hypothetical protein